MDLSFAEPPGWAAIGLERVIKVTAWCKDLVSQSLGKEAKS